MEAKKVLLVEDVEIMQLAAKSMLLRHRFHVSVASNYTSLMEVLQKDTSFDVIFLDLGLPDITIPELLLQIKNHYPAILPKVVALTAHSDPETKDLCAGYGLHHYLVKPLTDEVINQLDLLRN